MDITTETFEREVIEASKTLPVVVDFWAPWLPSSAVAGKPWKRCSILRRDKHWRDDEARRQLLALFGVAAGHPQLVAEYRRKLASMLYQTFSGRRRYRYRELN